MQHEFLEIITENNSIISFDRPYPNNPMRIDILNFEGVESPETIKPQLHYHDIFEISYILETPHPFIINQEIKIAHPGDIIVINPGEIHARMPVTNNVKFIRFMIDNSHLKKLGLNFDGKTIDNLIHDEKLKETMRKMHAIVLDKKHYYIKCYALALQIMIYIMKHHAKSISKVVRKQKQSVMAVQSAIKHMELHFAEDISFEKLSESLGYSQSHFNRMFIKALGVSPVSHLQIIRCREAKYMLKDSSLTVADVASKCGFKNPAYFSKIYKRIMGKMPNKDRN